MEVSLKQYEQQCDHVHILVVCNTLELNIYAILKKKLPVYSNLSFFELIVI